MEVVRPELLRRIDLVHAPADQVGAELQADLRLANPKTLVLHTQLALDGEDVGDPHPRKTRRWPFRPQSGAIRGLETA
jgi:hypothetical protein